MTAVIWDAAGSVLRDAPRVDGGVDRLGEPLDRQLDLAAPFERLRDDRAGLRLDRHLRPELGQQPHPLVLAPGAQEQLGEEALCVVNAGVVTLLVHRHRPLRQTDGRLDLAGVSGDLRGQR